MAGKMGGGDIVYVYDGGERKTAIVVALALGAWLGFCIGVAFGRALTPTVECVPETARDQGSAP